MASKCSTALLPISTLGKLDRRRCGNGPLAPGTAPPKKIHQAERLRNAQIQAIGNLERDAGQAAAVGDQGAGPLNKHAFLAFSSLAEI